MKDGEAREMEHVEVREGQIGMGPKALTADLA
jgi:hypothetical protein